jgi:small redox-active disulfide protein 2
MNIEILGKGCSKCNKLELNVKKALEETIDESLRDVQVVKINDIRKIAEYGILLTPAIAIDGIVKSYGKIASVNEIKQYLKECINTDESKYK